MDQALANALKRRQELENELKKLDQFIHMYHQLAGTNREELDTRTPTLNSVLNSAYAQGGGVVASSSAGMIRPRGRPADFARIMETILKDIGRPLQRGELVEEVERRGHSIPSEDKPRYLGTILWRREDIFESVGGRGYWLKGVPVPPEYEGENLGLLDPDLPQIEEVRTIQHLEYTLRPEKIGRDWVVHIESKSRGNPRRTQPFAKPELAIAEAISMIEHG